MNITLNTKPRALKRPKVVKPKKQSKTSPKMTRIDPTRTATLRRSFSSQLRKRFALLKGRIVKLIVDDDVFGLKEPIFNTFNPDQPRDEHGKFLKGISTAIALGKTAIGKVGKAEHWVTHKLAQGVEALPSILSAPLKLGWAGVMASFNAVEGAAEAIHKERGYSDEQAGKMRAMLTAMDFVAAKPVVFMAHAHHLSDALGFVPVASSVYCAYATVRNPLATLRAAGKAVGRAIDKTFFGLGDIYGPGRGEMSHNRNELHIVTEADLIDNRSRTDEDKIADALEAYDFDDWYALLLCAAKDHGLDTDKAIEVATAAHKEQVENANPDQQQDEKGRFTVVGYHGTASEFDKLEARIPKSSTGEHMKGIYFSGDERSAHGYARLAAKKSGGRTRVITAMLSMDNPLDITDEIKKGRKKGLSFGDAKRKALKGLTPEHDGVIFRGNSMNPPEYIVFDHSKVNVLKKPTENTRWQSENAFCPTGEGGGKDNSCSPKSIGKLNLVERAKKLAEAKVERDRRAETVIPESVIIPNKLYVAMPRHAADLALRNGHDGAVKGVMGHENNRRDSVYLATHKEITHHYAAQYNHSKILEVDSTKLDRSKFYYDATEPPPLQNGTHFNDAHPGYVAYRGKIPAHALRDATRNRLAINARWQFHTQSQQLETFKTWMRGQINETIRGKQEDALWTAYAEQGYKKGAGRAFDDVKKPPTGAKEKLDFYQGTRSEFLRSSFANPISVEKIRALASRSLNDLEGVTDSMATSMTRVLADGLVQGRNPRDIANDLSDQVDISSSRAETIARTEIIRAHSEGQLDAMENMGVEEVGVAVEWDTAGDGRVCPLCAPLEGIVLTLNEARGMLPRHPNCRCCWTPANVGEDDDEQIRSKKEIRAAVKESAQAGGDGFSIDVGSSRPQSILNQLRDLSPVDPYIRLFSNAKGDFFKECARDDKGHCEVGSAGSSAKEKPEKSKDIIDTKKTGWREKVKANENEKTVAKIINGDWETDNKFFDTKTKDNKHYVEVKSSFGGKKQEITCHEDALLRKVDGMMGNKTDTETMQPIPGDPSAKPAPRAKLHTVFFDERGTWGGGEFSERYSGHPLYYKRGFGRYKTKHMYEVRSMAELKKLINTPDDQLPEKARGGLPSSPKEIAQLRVKALKASKGRKEKDRDYKEGLKTEGKSAYDRKT